MADPRTLDDMRSFGFNLFNTANNHSCDYSHGGILATIRNLEGHDLAGTGKNLSKHQNHAIWGEKKRTCRNDCGLFKLP